MISKAGTQLPNSPQTTIVSFIKPYQLIKGKGKLLTHRIYKVLKHNLSDIEDEDDITNKKIFTMGPEELRLGSSLILNNLIPLETEYRLKFLLTNLLIFEMYSLVNP